MNKDKKKTLTISSSLKKKIDTRNLNTAGKKSFSIEKKKSFRDDRNINKFSANPLQTNKQHPKKKNFARKFVEQQTTKDFIKKDNKPAKKKQTYIKKSYR